MKRILTVILIISVLLTSCSISDNTGTSTLLSNNTNSQLESNSDNESESENSANLIKENTLPSNSELPIENGSNVSAATKIHMLIQFLSQHLKSTQTTHQVILHHHL